MRKTASTPHYTSCDTLSHGGFVLPQGAAPRKKPLRIKATAVVCNPPPSSSSRTFPAWAWYIWGQGQGDISCSILIVLLVHKYSSKRARDKFGGEIFHTLTNYRRGQESCLKGRTTKPTCTNFLNEIMRESTFLPLVSFRKQPSGKDSSPLPLSLSSSSHLTCEWLWKSSQFPKLFLQWLCQKVRFW